MKIVQFLQDGSGNLSATRLGFLLWVIGVLLVWADVSITHPESVHGIDNSVLTLIGILMSGKVVQSFSANDGPTPPGGGQPPGGGKPLTPIIPQGAMEQ
ncbi:hypothetical protein [Ralstonia solanacearum]|uniref:hypothetical protein n=1 Tax=Ralstonia solanacearum TaxID=305 RepID=UPI0018D1D450|nr:hypothetical protein [Ralstonia solanacearum]MDB0510056.1 hypothetical protein [Ralstonia solanacearum]MDB0514749.1 hypothetical protein [Ralstonia solanacearum]MDC6212461.1 hypothetical protein [Ralstonia solanacearum]MDD7803012.1 hypothetical protein [Ralstonia solanacearum]